MSMKMRVCLEKRIAIGECEPRQLETLRRKERQRAIKLPLTKRSQRETSAFLKTNVICLVSCLLIQLINLQISPLFLVESTQTTTTTANPTSDHPARDGPAQQQTTSNTNNNSPSTTPQASSNATPPASLTNSTSSPHTSTFTQQNIPSKTTTIELPEFINASNSLISASIKQRRAISSSDFRQLHAEADILPFSDFNVQQPTFSDLIRIWPPTTQHQLRQLQQQKDQQQRQKTSSAASRHEQSNARKQLSKQPHESQHWWSFGADSGSSQDSQQLRNNLNEDLDDTIVTADQSFEKEQSSEPAPYVNYLGDFIGDFLYDKLRKFFERQLDTTSSSQSSINQTSSTSNVVSNLRASLEELLDDYYYQQYENSQVLYYGTQLAREGDTVEIGCFMPLEQTSEWTKSALPIAQQQQQQDSPAVATSQRDVIIEPGSSLPRVIKRTEFLGAKLNFSLKIFEAQVSDSGNYRCNRMSRKYHKLLIVPQKIKQDQLFTIQQRLLSIVNPKALAETTSNQQELEHPEQMRGPTFASYYPPPHILRAVWSAEPRLAPQVNHQQPPPSRQQMQRPNSRQKSAAAAQFAANNINNIFRQTNLPPSETIVEHEQMIISCNITDEFILRKMRDNELFRVDWYKNNKLIRLPTPPPQQQQPAQHSGQLLADESLGPQSTQQKRAQAKRRQQQQSQQLHHQNQQQQPKQLANQASISNERIHATAPNNRQLVISPAYYSDAGDYRCSWARLTNRQRNEQQSNQAPENQADSPAASESDSSPAASTISAQMLAPSSLTQLVTPTRLRPFARSVFHAREGSELRIACFAQGGYPSPIIEWYVGNRLVDEDYLRSSEVRILQLKSSGVTQLVALGSSNKSAAAATTSSPKLQIVEINPIPARNQAAMNRVGSIRQQQHQSQMQQQHQLNWIDYRDASDERLALETAEQQLRYAQFKMAQLLSLGTPAPLVPGNVAIGEQLASSLQQAALLTSSAASSQPNLLSILVIPSLELERHSARIACRAVTRVNTDEVTTVVKVLTSSTITVQPSTGRATLIYGQNLNLECAQVGNDKAYFKWFRRAQDNESAPEEPILPEHDDVYEVLNSRLILKKPNYEMAGDYICRALKSEDKLEPDQNEFAVIKVRAQPYIEDFNSIQMSHTGKSTILTDGDRLELLCKVDKIFGPLNITWYRSQSADNDSVMVELESSVSKQNNQDLATASTNNIIGPNTFQVPNDNHIIIEEIDSHTKRLIIGTVKQDHRGYYTCLANNGVTERTKKFVYLRVKDKLAALWPALGIIAEIFILLTIIQIWETQRAYKEVNSSPPAGQKTPKKTLPCVVVPSETVPLTSG